MICFPHQRAVPQFPDQIPPAAGERFARRQFHSTQLGRLELLSQAVQYHHQPLQARLASFLDEQAAQLLPLCHSRYRHSRHQERMIRCRSWQTMHVCHRSINAAML
eukprot:SAG31_NODE_15564_length_748_cov_2.200308_1_plen_105_part_10